MRRELGRSSAARSRTATWPRTSCTPRCSRTTRSFVTKYGDLSVLPTKYFLSKPEIGEEFHVELEKGKVLILKLLAVGPLSENTGQREAFYEMNGEVRQVAVDDKKASVENVSRPKADPTDSSQVGAPMAGVLVELRVHDGTEVKKGDPLAVLSAMKMVSKPIPPVVLPPVSFPPAVLSPCCPFPLLSSPVLSFPPVVLPPVVLSPLLSLLVLDPLTLLRAGNGHLGSARRSRVPLSW